MKITLYMIRHGLSCCNVLHHKELRLAMFNLLHKDPYLSNKGVHQSLKCQAFLKSKNVNVDVVLCSSLIRAIETAVYMFPENRVEIAPYICEERCSLENTPYETKRQKDRLQKHVEGYERVKHCKQTKGLSDTNLKEFIKYITENYDTSLRIAVVTHSNFLMKILKTNERMNNNSIFKVVIDTDTYEVDSYETVFSGYVFPNQVSFDMSIRH